MINEVERLRVLLYEYFFFNEVKYKNKVISLSNLCNFSKVDLDLLYRLHNSKIEYNTFNSVMEDVTSILADFV